MFMPKSFIVSAFSTTRSHGIASRMVAKHNINWLSLPSCPICSGKINCCRGVLALTSSFLFCKFFIVKKCDFACGVPECHFACGVPGRRASCGVLACHCRRSHPECNFACGIPECHVASGIPECHVACGIPECHFGCGFPEKIKCCRWVNCFDLPSPFLRIFHRKKMGPEHGDGDVHGMA